MLPAGLQSLTFGEECDGLEDVILPSGLQKLLLNGVCVCLCELPWISTDPRVLQREMMTWN
jgi:hypothetical protein